MIEYLNCFLPLSWWYGYWPQGTGWSRDSWMPGTMGISFQMFPWGAIVGTVETPGTPYPPDKQPAALITQEPITSGFNENTCECILIWQSRQYGENEIRPLHRGSTGIVCNGGWRGQCIGSCLGSRYRVHFILQSLSLWGRGWSLMWDTYIPCIVPIFLAHIHICQTIASCAGKPNCTHEVISLVQQEGLISCKYLMRLMWSRLVVACFFEAPCVVQLISSIL